MTNRPWTGLLSVPTAILLASCGGGGSDGGGEAEGPQPVRVSFEATGGSAAEGAFTLTLEGDTYAASVAIDTYRGPGDYPIEIHAGTCAGGEGPLVLLVTEVEGQEGGEGQSSGRFPASELAGGGPFYVDIHDAQDDTAIACADLPPL